MAESRFFFNHQNKIILKSSFPVSINFVWGTLHLCLPQPALCGPVYVTHNQVYVKFTATLYRMACELSPNKTSKRKVLLGNLQLEHILFYFHSLFQLFFELEKKSSLVTRTLSTKSCTRDTDSLHLALG